MKKVFFFLFLVLSVPQIIHADSSPKIRVAALSGNVGLAMLKIMQEPASQDFPYQFEVFKTPDLAVGKLIAGEADIAGLPTNTAAVMYNKGAEIQVASVIGWGVMYIVSNDPMIKKWSDLKGKEIYVPSKGALSDILLRYLVSKNHLNPDRDVTILYTASAVEAAQLAASGKATLTALPEPWVAEVLERNSGLTVVLDYQQEWQRIEKQGSFYPQTCIVVRKEFSRQRPEALRRFLHELESSIEWVNQHPKAAGLLAEKYIQISAHAVERGLDRTNLRYRAVFEVQAEIVRFLERLVEFAPESVGGKLPDENFYAKP